MRVEVIVRLFLYIIYNRVCYTYISNGRKQKINENQTVKMVAKAGFTRLENYIKTINPNTVDTDILNLKLEKLKVHWKSLEESLTTIYDEETSDDQEIELELINYEEKYINLRVSGKK